MVYCSSLLVNQDKKERKKKHKLLYKASKNPWHPLI